MSKIGDEIVYRVRKTVAGFCVEVRDGTGLSRGDFTKRDRRYFYGNNPERQATAYAERQAHMTESDARVVEWRGDDD